MSNECRHCHAYVRWAKVNGKWKLYDTESNPHNCPGRAQALREKYAGKDAKKAAANDLPEKDKAA